MIFKKNGISNKIILEKNDNILEIYANSSVIKQELIKEKNTNNSTENIIEKCDKWLEMFKQVHNIYKNMVLKEEYKDKNLTMDLTFGTFFSINNEFITGNTIALILRQFDTILSNGISIYIEDCNKDVYKYLVASVLSYYISHNYNSLQIKDFNGILYSKYEPNDKKVVPIMSSLALLIKDAEYKNLVSGMIGLHNMGISSESSINQLKYAVENIGLDINMKSAIKQFETFNEHKDIILKKVL